MGLVILPLTDGVNMAERATLTLTPAAHADYPGTRLSDRILGMPAKWGSYNVASRIATGSLARITNTGFEVDLTGWTDSSVGGGTAVRSTAEFNSGVASLRLNFNGIGGAAGGRYWEVEEAAGSHHAVTAYAKAVGGSTAAVRVFCVETGHFLQSDGTWAAAANSFLGTTSATWAQVAGGFRVEPYRTTKKKTVTLRIELRCTGECFFDDVNFVPGINHVSWHAHTLDPRWSYTIEASSDGAAWTDLTVLLHTYSGTFGHPSFYYRITPFGGNVAVYAAYFRVNAVWTGTGVAALSSGLAAPLLGELVLGYEQPLSNLSLLSPSEGAWGQQLVRPQVRTATPGGHAYVTNRNSRGHRMLDFPVVATSVTAFDELVEEIFERTGGGEDPIVLIPDTGEPAIYFGRVRDVLPTRRERKPFIAGSPFHAGTIELEELPGFAVGV